MKPNLSPFISNITKKLSSPLESLRLKALDGSDKPNGGMATESATVDSATDSSPSCGNNVNHLTTAPISPCSSVSEKSSPARNPAMNNSRSRSAQQNATEEKSPADPEFETYKALLKATTRQTKKSPMRQNQNNKESLADYKDLVDIHYRRKDKRLDVPLTSIHYHSRPRDDEDSHLTCE